MQGLDERQASASRYQWVGQGVGSLVGHQCSGKAEEEVGLQGRYSFQTPSREDWKSRTARWVAVSSLTAGRQVV